MEMVFLDHSNRICGYIDQTNRRHSLLTEILQGSLAILLFFTLEESLYPRSYITPKSDSSSASTLDTAAVKDGKNQMKDRDESSSTDSPPSEISEIKMKSYWETHPLHVWGTNPKQTWRDLFFRPYLLARFPPVLWAGMFTGIAVCWWAAMFTTQSGEFPPMYPTKCGLKV